MDRFIESLRASATRFSDAVRRGPLDAPVAACPGWTLTDLSHHMGYIHRWARQAAMTSAVPDESTIDVPPTAEAGADSLAEWIDVGAERLIDTLQQLDPAAATWHPFSVPKVAAVWPRRQAHETQVHTWDAEHAVGSTSPLDADIAGDGIAEYFEVIAPRVVKRSGRVAPIGAMIVDCADSPTRLRISSSDGTIIQVDHMGAEDELRSPVLRGSAESLLLALWRRAPTPAGQHDTVIDQWLAFGGN